MKKCIILFPLFILTMSGIAQDSIPKKATKPSVEFKKNEIGLNVAPVFRVLMNAGGSGNGGATRFSASYKHYFNEHSGLRVVVVADLIQNDNYNYYGYQGREVFILKNDTTLVKQNNVSSSYLSPHLNLGYERMFGKRERLKWFYGADLSIGYSVKKDSKVITLMDHDTTQNGPAWVETIAYSEVISRTRVQTFAIGISPFFGAKYALSKHFSLSAQVGFDAGLKNQQVSENALGVNKSMRYSSFDFSMETGILNDVSLIYKF